MKNRNGFTLIELLAVILILGVIALIAMPAVTTVVKQAKRGAFDSTVKNIIKEVQTECSLRQIGGGKTEVVYFFTHKGVSPTLDVTGKVPTSGFIKTDSNCNVKVSINDGELVAEKNFDEDNILLSEGIPKPYGNNIVESYEQCRILSAAAIESLQRYPEIIPAVEVMENKMCYSLELSEEKIENIGVVQYFDTTDKSIVETYANIAFEWLVDEIADPETTPAEQFITQEGDLIKLSVVVILPAAGNYEIESLRTQLTEMESSGLELTRYISYK